MTHDPLVENQQTTIQFTDPDHFIAQFQLKIDLRRKLPNLIERFCEYL